jgi:hypothetical protein
VCNENTVNLIIIFISKKFTLLDKLMLIPVANPMTLNQIMLSDEIAEDILI